MISALILSALPSLVQEPQVSSAGFQTVRRYEAGARQGVAVGPADVYAVSNSSIRRLDKASGQERAAWSGDPVLFPHINSCTLIETDLVCASSNYPASPHVSTLETFDALTLEHRSSLPLPGGLGSATWADRRQGVWFVMFANYDARGSEAPRTSTDTVLVRFAPDWRPEARWTLPSDIVDRLRPMSLSGGGWGPDGRLYLSGHDHPELYVVDLPQGGGTMVPLETLAMEAEGQAIDWDDAEPGMLYGITRRTREILAMRAPPTVVGP